MEHDFMYVYQSAAMSRLAKLYGEDAQLLDATYKVSADQKNLFVLAVETNCRWKRKYSYI